MLRHHGDTSILPNGSPRIPRLSPTVNPTMAIANSPPMALRQVPIRANMRARHSHTVVPRLNHMDMLHHRNHTDTPRHRSPMDMLRLLNLMGMRHLSPTAIRHRPSQDINPI